MKEKLARALAHSVARHWTLYKLENRREAELLGGSIELETQYALLKLKNKVLINYKRGFDVIFASITLSILLPLLLLVSLCILITDGRPIFFRQSRVGLGGKLFGCLKFRTMVRDADRQLQSLLAESEASRQEWAETQKLRNDPRIHWIGRILRKTSVDELPQFINVLMGHMSVVGPRPIVMDEIPRYGQDFVHYASVRPGITGLWQVSGRNSLCYAERVALDASYARSVTLLGDAQIILKTVAIVLSADGDHH